MDSQSRKLLEAFEPTPAGPGPASIGLADFGDPRLSQAVAQELVTRGWLRPLEQADRYARTEDGRLALGETAGRHPVHAARDAICARRPKRRSVRCLRRAGARLREVNIDVDPVLRALYDYDVPVILLGARKVAKHRVDLEQFRRQLEEARRSAPRRGRLVLRRRLDADAFVRHGARTSQDPVVRGDLARRAQRLVVIGGHANCVAQLFVELAQIPEVAGQGGNLSPVVGDQKFLVAGIPQARELALEHDGRQDGHLIAPARCAPELRAAAIFLYAHDAARAADPKALRGQGVEGDLLEAILYVPHGAIRIHVGRLVVNRGDARMAPMSYAAVLATPLFPADCCFPDAVVPYLFVVLSVKL